MAWILPGSDGNPVMQHKAILATSLGFSRTFNSRNIEFPWYALWDQKLSDLVADVPHLIVTPQFPVWFVPPDDHEDEKGGAPGRQADDDDEEAWAGDTSFASTIPAKRAKSVVVDFVILNLGAVAQPEYKRNFRYKGWRITAASIGLLVEVKRFVCRSLKGQEQKAEILRRVTEAKGDLLNQAAHIFVQDPKRDSVLAIAAAGPYWSSTTIRRTNVTKKIHGLSVGDPDYQATSERPSDTVPHWNAVLRVDLARSSDRLHTIYKSLKKMNDDLDKPADV
ncbi:hypothetical protein DEU56DRAFT_938392 [Suillus clintonianus]|uniref:uncharacterized protein n=1 Tax=Suillus clintonianus TaxID=1904413 RepID=UPI001B882406|nr:uncharacterized protein DEU56DRAFT_938392 [Suillus clintonianus]KAG2110417.1 hypothetical protein DEU56DRAFT_938392 [Suillus clintonianus]